jgi:protein-disulfide isomerase
MVKWKDNTNILYIVVTILVLVIVWLLGYLLGQNWNWNSNVLNTPLIVEAGKIGIDTDDLKECIASNKYLNKINSQMKVGQENFGITWTPGNVLINNETWEYDVISWAYPKESFIAIIDRLLLDKVESNNNTPKRNFKENTSANTVVIISDKRDYTTTIERIVSELKKIEAIKSMKIEEYDFSDTWVSEYLKENEIKVLPAIIFSKNKIDSKIDNSLVKLKNESYSLDIRAKFDPFVELTPKWFKIIDKNILDQIKKSSYIDWNKDTKITWLEYSDLECPFCAKLHNSDVEATLKAKYGTDLNIIFNHFPLGFHKKAIPAANILECVWEQWGSESFYKIMRYAYKNEIQE